MMLIENADRAWRLLTIHVGSAAVVFGLLPADQQVALLEMLRVPPERVPAILGIAFIAARLFRQRGAIDSQKPKDE